VEWFILGTRWLLEFAACFAARFVDCRQTGRGDGTERGMMLYIGTGKSHK